MLIIITSHFFGIYAQASHAYYKQLNIGKYFKLLVIMPTTILMTAIHLVINDAFSYESSMYLSGTIFSDTY